MPKATTLFHYCCKHSHDAIGAEGKLVAPVTLSPEQVQRVADLAPPLQLFLSFIWLTDLAEPDRNGLGLTMDAIACDRLQHRYRVTDPSSCEPYGRHRMRLSTGMRDLLELAEGAMPARWWVSTDPVPVVYDPLPDPLP